MAGARAQGGGPTRPAGVYTPALVKAALAHHAPDPLAIEGFRNAAVLVPLLDGPAGLELLLTVRASTLRSHAGQIALPGGRLEPGESFVEAAIRETAEEVGLEVQPQAVVGELSDHPSPAGYVARPIVAMLAWPQPVSVDPGEVAEVFTVPLSELRAVVPRSELRELKDFKRRIFFYQWRERNIWGFTGNVIKDLFDVLDDYEADRTGADRIRAGVGSGGSRRGADGRRRDPFTD